MVYDMEFSVKKSIMPIQYIWWIHGKYVIKIINQIKGIL
jgi:hypothetical protein